MRPDKQCVGKSDIQFLDTIKDKFVELGTRIVASKTRTKQTFTGYGVKVSRETETVTTTLTKGEPDDRT